MTTTAGHSFYIGPIVFFYNQVNNTGSWEPLVFQELYDLKLFSIFVKKRLSWKILNKIADHIKPISLCLNHFFFFFFFFFKSYMTLNIFQFPLKKVILKIFEWSGIENNWDHCPMREWVLMIGVNLWWFCGSNPLKEILLIWFYIPSISATISASSLWKCSLVFFCRTNFFCYIIYVFSK